MTRDFIFSGERLQLTAEGLLADTEYQVEGLAVNRAGAGPSREAVFRTSEEMEYSCIRFKGSISYIRMQAL